MKQNKAMQIASLILLQTIYYNFGHFHKIIPENIMTSIHLIIYSNFAISLISNLTDSWCS